MNSSPGAKVLVVEDEGSSTTDLTRRLGNLGCSVCGIAEYGGDAVCKARELGPDVAFLNVQTRGAVKSVSVANALEMDCDIPVIFLSSNSHLALLESDFLKDRFTYLPVPFSDVELEISIRMAIFKHQAGRRLRESEKAFRKLAEYAPDAVVRFGRHERCLFANSALKKATGLDPEEVVGTRCVDWNLAPHSCARWSEFIQNIFLTGKAQQMEFLSPDGSLCYQVRGAPELSDEGGIKSIIAIATDVTALKRSENELRELTQRLIYHVNNSPLSIIEWGADARIIRWSGEAESMFGWKAWEMEGKKRQDMPWIHSEDEPRFAQIYSRLQIGAELSAFAQVRCFRKDGSLVYCEWYHSSLLDESGRCCSILSFVLDVSAREKAEQELHKLNAQLDLRILERTASLRRTNEELQKEILARRQLEADIIKISELEQQRIGRDLHDGICQEMAGINFSLEAMARNGHSVCAHKDDLLKIAGTVRQSIEHIRLVSRGLALTELEAGDLGSALAELARNSGILFGISCKFCSDAPSSLDLSKATHLYRIVQEAIQNSVKHGGATEIVIQCEFVGSNGRISILDNGSGLVKDGRKNGNHSGMGLITMNHRANLIGGRLEILSSKEGGTRVECTFPHDGAQQRKRKKKQNSPR
ncbi:MAG: PAS domain S-box protein [Terrimicrobiaceae bacterium]